MQKCNLILHVTGIFKPFTKVLRMSFALLELYISDAPIPPLIENSFGHPMLTSIAATSDSTLYGVYEIQSGMSEQTRFSGTHQFGDFKCPFSVGRANLKCYLLLLQITCSKHHSAIGFVHKVNGSQHICGGF